MSNVDPKTAKMLIWIANSVDRSKLRALYDNSTEPHNRGKPGVAEIERAALQRLWALDGLDHDDPLHRDFAVMLAAYEHTLMLKHGKNQPAIRTRRKLANKGVVQCLEDWALGTQETAGFQRLLELGFPQYTGEAVVLRHVSRFDERVVAAARARLSEHGIDEDQILIVI